jgi:acetyl-CoA C-acetyltransferase
MDAFIYDYVRSPRGRGRADGSLHEVTPASLMSQVLCQLRERIGPEGARVGDVILGCATPVGEQGMDIARTAALLAGYDESVPGQQINRFCASGLDALNTGAAKVAAGQSDAVIAGGVEMMSRVPMGSDGGAWASDPSVAARLNYVPQGISADLLATIDGFTREELDAYALESQRRAAAAWSEGRFSRSVIPIRDITGAVLLARDELIRADATAENLASLRPAFEDLGRRGFDAVARIRYPQLEAIRHVHTAGNSSGVVDGAAAVLIGTRDFGRRVGLLPRARVRAFVSVGSEPTLMLTAPGPATVEVLRRCKLTLDEIDLFEVNEAFAAVVLHYQRETGVAPEKCNVNGGSIAMGHPLGATGAILVGTLLEELERRGGALGLVTLCAGAGMGTATIIERF